MPALTRRLYPYIADCWHVYYGDVRVGSIALRTGQPRDEDPWEWNCGFYPGCQPGEHQAGTAATFDQARAEFEDAWRVFLANRTEADFQAWRDERDWTDRKYAMWERGERLPSQIPTSLMRCRCGETFDSHVPAATQLHAPHIYAAQAVRA